MSVGARWILPTRQPELEARIAGEFGLTDIAALILVQRGVTGFEDIDQLLNPRLSNLHSPRLLPDYEAASHAILGAIERGETIYVHGDYDVDGMTSASILTRFLRKVGAVVVPHVPHRLREGYGIHIDAVKWAKDHGASLFLTCDCGTSAIDQLEAVREAGMIAVVTDHHALKEQLPFAAAVVNPHRKDANYPFPDLCGAGVALKLCAGLAEDLGFPVDKFYDNFLDLAVLGTIADVVPLTGENRIIAKLGLAKLSQTRKPGILALLEQARLDQNANGISAMDVGWKLGPRLNAAGRIDDASLGLDLLLSQDADESRKIAAKLEEINTTRRRMGDEALFQAQAMIEAAGMQNDEALVIASHGWHPGVIGLVAGRLVSAYHRPAFVATIDRDGRAKASARSIPGFHLADALNATAAHHLGGGGHEMAAGCSFREDQLDAFREALRELARTQLSPEDYIPKVRVDALVSVGELSLEDLADLSRLAPFGASFEEPTFACLGVELERIRGFTKPEQGLISFVQGRQKQTGATFSAYAELGGLAPGMRFDVIFKPENNNFKGRSELRWVLNQYRASEAA